MLANLYQHNAMKFAKYETPEYPFLGLSEESGEVIGKIAKYCRKNDTSAADAIDLANSGSLTEEIQLHKDLKKELGDVAWMLAACCYNLGLSLDEVMQSNLEKLQDRHDRGVIIGDGDDR